MLDGKATLEWVIGFPELRDTFGLPIALALGLRGPVERTLETTARIEYRRVIDALEADAAAIADAFSDTQKQRLGMSRGKDTVNRRCGIPTRRRRMEEGGAQPRTRPAPWGRVAQAKLADEVRDYRQ